MKQKIPFCCPIVPHIYLDVDGHIQKKEWQKVDVKNGGFLFAFGKRGRKKEKMKEENRKRKFVRSSEPLP